MADLDKNQKFNPFSEKSKELIRSMGNKVYFEMCEIISEVQCQDCLLYWRIDIVFCTCGACLRPSQRNRMLNKDRYDVLSIPNYVIKKGPSHGARHGPTQSQRLYCKAHNAFRKAQKHGHKTIIPEQPALSKITSRHRMGRRIFAPATTRLQPKITVKSRHRQSGPKKVG